MKITPINPEIMNAIFSVLILLIWLLKKVNAMIAPVWVYIDKVISFVRVIEYPFPAEIPALLNEITEKG